MTVLLTTIGVLVFLVSTFTVGFKAAFKRLVGFALTGLFLDVLLLTVAFLFSMGHIYY